jgi:hypothetical protein
MDSKISASDIKYIQQYLYEDLQLDAAQAEAVIRYQREEQELRLSGWEALDFEYDNFQRILRAEQWPRYEVRYAEALAWQEQELTKQNQQAADELPGVQDELRFYREEYVPGLYQMPRLFPFGHFELAKGDLLVAECHNYLRERKKKLVRRHYRRFRRLGPEVLAVALLRHEQQVLLPDLREFEQAADEPTQAVLTHWLARASRQVYAMHSAELSAMTERAVKFQQEAFHARHGKSMPEAAGGLGYPVWDEKQFSRNWAWQLLWLQQGWSDFKRQRRPPRKKK